MRTRLLSNAVYRKLAFKQWLRQMVFWVGAILVALTCIAFAWGANAAYDLFARATTAFPPVALAVCPAGLALSLYLTRRLFPGAEGSGIPQTIAAIQVPQAASGSGVLSLRIAFGKMLVTMLGLASGASIGREGPSVQVGAAIMYNLGRFTHAMPKDASRALILAGGAGGVAAAFNTPLAGIVFAIEELSRSFDERTSGRVFTAVIIAGIVSMAALGDYTYFGQTDASIDLVRGWLPVLTCGLIGGVMGGAFSQALIFLARGLPGRLGRWIQANPIAFAALCGVGIAFLGLATHGATYGTGYEQTKAILAGNQPVSLAWGLEKLLATVLSYASGVPGGVFAPSLAVGAGIGADLSPWFPDVPIGALIILGMGAYFTGVIQAPITAVVILMEMTDDQTITVPLMAAALVSYSVSRLVCPKPLYKAMAENFTAGIPVPGPAEMAAAERREIAAEVEGEPTPPTPAIPLSSIDTGSAS